jgi:hypothetical protein
VYRSVDPWRNLEAYHFPYPIPLGGPIRPEHFPVRTGGFEIFSFFLLLGDRHFHQEAALRPWVFTEVRWMEHQYINVLLKRTF